MMGELVLEAPGMPDMLVSLYDQYKLIEPCRPWEGEPDRAEWVEADTGLHGRIVRNEITHTLCGYVGVTSGELVGVDYNRVNMHDYSPHGGFTYSGWGGDKSNVWWFGFDCAHSEDFLPGLYIKMRMVNHSGKDSWPPTTNYRTWEFVDAEIAKVMEGIALEEYHIEREKGD
jgi:hypothetical protein